MLAVWTGLAPFTEYALRLRACNATGCSEWCGNVIISTSSHVPSCPRHVCAQSKPPESNHMQGVDSCLPTLMI